MTDEQRAGGKPKVARASGPRPPKGVFDLDNATAPTVEQAAPMTAEAPPEVRTVAAPQVASMLARTDKTDTWFGGVPAGPAPADPGAGAAPSLNLPLSALVEPVDPETDLVQFNVRIPRYLATAFDLACTARYGGSKGKGEHAKRALGDYLPPGLIDEAYRIHYRRNRPPS